LKWASLSIAAPLWDHRGGSFEGEFATKARLYLIRIHCLLWTAGEMQSKTPKGKFLSTVFPIRNLENGYEYFTGTSTYTLRRALEKSASLIGSSAREPGGRNSLVGNLKNV
jgi:hypothetical protein